MTRRSFVGLRALRAAMAAASTVGLSALSIGDLARTVGATARITRFAIRPVTLEDVYFATTGGSEGISTNPASVTGQAG